MESSSRERGFGDDVSLKERAASIRVGLALACALSSFLVTNGSIYPTIAVVDPWVREWATLFGVVVLVLMFWCARRSPQCLKPQLLNIVALASVAGYAVFDLAGLRLGSPWLLLLGSLLDSLAEAWLFVLAYVAFAQIETQRRPVVAMASCLAAYALQPVANVFAAPVAVMLNTVFFALIFLCVARMVKRPLAETAAAEPQAEMAVANPNSFLPSTHLLFIAVLVFSVAQGLMLALPGPFNDARSLPLGFVPLAVILLVYLARRRMPNADGLFGLCALLIIAGMFLLPSDRLVSGGAASIANTLIDAGASCFNFLIVLLVGSIASRNRLTAFPTAALMLGLYWSGVGIGAVLGNGAMALLGWTEQALVWLSFASAMTFIVFCFVVLKNVSFAEAIGALQPPVPVEAPAEPAAEEERALPAEVAKQYGLTPRETEVFELLAQGRTVGIIREKLVISLNTARFHTKNIYVKLGVHSQQELIDLVENFEASS